MFSNSHSCREHVLCYYSFSGNATEHSEKCCETMVNAGAIDILLKQVHMLNRGIPDQEVIKHVLSTLRNIVRHPLLLQVFIDTPHSGEIIFQEVLRFGHLKTLSSEYVSFSWLLLFKDILSVSLFIVWP